jgi:hypothetical protein
MLSVLIVTANSIGKKNKNNCGSVAELANLLNSAYKPLVLLTTATTYLG